MKVIILIVSSLILYCSNAYGQTKNLDIDIRGRSCQGGSGVCSMGPTGLKQTNTGMKNYTITKLSSKSMIIEIELSKLNLEEQKVFFGKEYSKSINPNELFFIQEQDFVFDLNTMLYLELDPAYRLLKRGTYPLQVVNDKIQVTLPLSELK